MKNRLKELFKDKESFKAISGVIDSETIYIIDKTKEANGGVCVQTFSDSWIKSVTVNNKSKIDVDYYIFENGSFKYERYNNNGDLIGFESKSYRHCECILFPDRAENGWVLVVETKYAANKWAASNKHNGYPHSMIEQIVSTCEYLRRHGVIPPHVMVDAIVAFPNVITNFQSTLFGGYVYRENEHKLDIRKPVTDRSMSITQIRKKYKIRISAQNSLEIVDGSRLNCQIS